MILYRYRKILFVGSLWLMKLAIIWEWHMILVKHMEESPILVIKKITLCHMEAHLKNGQNAAKRIFKHVTCKGPWKVNGAWKVSVAS